MLVDKYTKLPTIDLTWFCKNDLEINTILIKSFDLFIFIGNIFFIGDFAEHEEDLKVEKLWVPSNTLAPFLISFKSIFFFICQALFLLIDNVPCLLTIKYS